MIHLSSCVIQKKNEYRSRYNNYTLYTLDRIENIEFQSRVCTQCTSRRCRKCIQISVAVDIIFLLGPKKSRQIAVDYRWIRLCTSSFDGDVMLRYTSNILLSYCILEQGRTPSPLPQSDIHTFEGIRVVSQGVDRQSQEGSCQEERHSISANRDWWRHDDLHLSRPLNLNFDPSSSVSRIVAAPQDPDKLIH